MNYILLIGLFIVKVIDNILATGKTILIQKNKAGLAAITVIISQIIFYKLISAVVSADNDTAMIIVSIGSGFGTYLALKFNDKFSKDRLYVNVIFSDNKEALMDFRDYLASHKITNNVTDSYTKDWDKTISLTIYSQTKNESRIVDDYIANSNEKFKRVIYK